MYANLSFSQKLPHIFPIVPVYFVIIEVIFTMNYYIIFTSESKTFLKIFGVAIFEPLAIMTIITHLKSMFTDPGYVPIPYNSIETFDSKDKKDPEIFCQKCNNPRPRRAHHCKICRKCTLKMDHHCPWIANCVGYYNQKNFYQFLFYSTFGDLSAFIILLIQLFILDYSIKAYVPKDVKITSAFQLIWFMWKPIQTFIGCACAFAMTISIGTLFNKQTNMLLMNQTTIDKKMFPNWEISPYYEPNKKKNFESVMGTTLWNWISLRFGGEIPFTFDKVVKYTNLEDM